MLEVIIIIDINDKLAVGILSTPENSFSGIPSQTASTLLPDS